MFDVQIQSTPIAPGDDDGAFVAGNERCGAVVRFVGRVRNDPSAGAALTHLELEHFPGVTEQEIARIITQARARWDLQRVRVVHRVGRILAGELIVLVETASAHRRDAYEANQFVMDYLKTEAPFWKQECFANASAHWVEAKNSDQAARVRWAEATSGPAFAPTVAAQAAGALAGHPVPRIGALVLAGGQGRRMGGRNKGLQLLGGQPLVRHAVAALQAQTVPLQYIAISANQDLPAYQALGLPVFPDDAPWLGNGPMAGLLSALPQFPPGLDALLTVPCDTPFLPQDLAERLGRALFAPEAKPAMIAASADGEHPSIAMFRPALLLGMLRELMLAPNERRAWSLRHWMQRGGYDAVHFDDAHAFANLNDWDALQQLQQLQ